MTVDDTRGPGTHDAGDGQAQGNQRAARRIEHPGQHETDATGQATEGQR